MLEAFPSSHAVILPNEIGSQHAGHSRKHEMLGYFTPYDLRRWLAWCGILGDHSNCMRISGTHAGAGPWAADAFDKDVWWQGGASEDLSARYQQLLERLFGNGSVAR